MFHSVGLKLNLWGSFVFSTFIFSTLKAFVPLSSNEIQPLQSTYSCSPYPSFLWSFSRLVLKALTSGLPSLILRLPVLLLPYAKAVCLGLLLYPPCLFHGSSPSTLFNSPVKYCRMSVRTMAVPSAQTNKPSCLCLFCVSLCPHLLFVLDLHSCLASSHHWLPAHKYSAQPPSISWTVAIQVLSLGLSCWFTFCNFWFFTFCLFALLAFLSTSH